MKLKVKRFREGFIFAKEGGGGGEGDARITAAAAAEFGEKFIGFQELLGISEVNKRSQPRRKSLVPLEESESALRWRTADRDLLLHPMN